MVILDHLPLFISRVLRQQAAAAERNPLNKEIEGLAFIRCRLNRPPEFDIGYVVEQERCPHHARPNSRKAKYNLFLLEYVASRQRQRTGTRMQDLPTSLCANLIAEACNIGLEPLTRNDVSALRRARLSWVMGLLLWQLTRAAIQPRYCAQFRGFLPLPRRGSRIIPLPGSPKSSRKTGCQSRLNR
jgi:hypothetical protein